MIRIRFVAIATLTALAILWSCDKNSTGDGDADDGNTPYYIGDFTVGSVTDSTVLLTWTATGDDSNSGTASTYDIRYWHTWIAPVNWDSAHQIIGEPHPKVAGSKESLLVHNLKKDTTYFFSLKVCDEANNCAGSSGATGTCFSDYVVTFVDHHLDSAIRALLTRPSGDIMVSDLRHYDYFSANGAGIADLSGMEHWKSLQALALLENNLTSLAPLSSLTNLVNLGLNGNNISDLSPLAGLSKLNGLSIVANNVTDLSPLASVTTLTGLGLTANSITNIQPLASLVHLEILQLRSNHVVDISPLAGLTTLTKIDLTQNQITSLAALVANSGFAAGDTVWVGENPLSDEAKTVQVPALQGRGAAVMGL